MSVKPVRGVIFDFEGTLVDFQWRLAEGEAALRDAFSVLGISREELAAESYSTMWNRSLSEGLVDADETELRRLVGPVYDRYDLDALSRWEARPAAAATLRALRGAGLASAIVSNIGRIALLPALERFGLADFLDPVLARDDLRLMKPDPEGIWRVLDAWQMEPTEVLFVGDSRTDVRASRAAGVRVAILIGGESAADVLVAEPPDFMLEGLGQVLDLVRPPTKGG